MQTQNFMYSLSLVIAILYLSACTSSPPQQPAPSNPKQTRQLPSNVDTSHPRAKLVIGSNELRGRVKLHSPIFGQVGQLTKTQVQLDNLSGLALDLRYRIDWSDDDGFKVGTINSWQFVSLAPRGSESLTSVGKMPEATRITVTVRLTEDMFDTTPEPAQPEVKEEPKKVEPESAEVEVAEPQVVVLEAAKPEVVEADTIESN